MSRIVARNTAAEPIEYPGTRTDPPTEQEPPAPRPDGRRRLFKYLRIALVAALLVGVGVWAADWIRASFLYVHETDARVHSEMVSVSSRVSGWIVEMPATSGLVATKGSMLARIDDREARLRLTEMEAELEGIDAERARIEAEIRMVDLRTESRYSSEQAKLTAAEALVESLEAEVAYAKTEFERAETLSKRGVVPARELDRQRTAYLRAQQELLRSRAAVATETALLAEARAERQQLDVLERERALLDHRKAEIQARIDRQKLDIEDRTIASTLNGVVSRTFVAPGEYVIPGQRIAMMHDPEDIWVEANIRETEVRKLAVGQEVTVEVDAYPERPFKGHVTRIGHAATSQFSLLPSSNPSGNFTKITQRLPVRIAVEQEDGLLRPGMMVEVYIDVHDR